ncbi:MAG: S-methyl-5'-thioadenosine phosphorylase [Propionibacteriales bacterium]|nr:S-methyl-5'-thioadenosine phosphorylase [Propionibacteriales bacterium]
MTRAAPSVAVIGGSGFYTFLDDVEDVRVETPYGEPSAPIAIGDLDGRSVAFLPRHGKRHEFPPHRINYRANLWALRSVGVRRVLAPCAVGSLTPDLGPGDLVAPDQLVDRTTSRVQTFMDDGPAHVGFADPYCPDLRAALVGTGEAVDGGTMVVIEGPRFSTRAESQWYAAQGWSLVNMTGHPEAVLARELALCYAAAALVTDRDEGIDAGESVDQHEVFEVFAANTERLRSLLRDVITGLADEPGCSCRQALEGVDLPFELP